MKTFSIFLCLLVVLTTSEAHSDLVKRSVSCPEEWTEIEGRCFLYVAATMPWADAEKNCLSKGGNLASVHSAAEDKGIKMMIAKVSHAFGKTWLGGSDCQKEGTWLWSDGTPFDYQHCGSFDNLWLNQHCLQMNHGKNRCWDDTTCSRNRASVCARKPLNS